MIRSLAAVVLITLFGEAGFGQSAAVPNFHEDAVFNERVASFDLEPEVKVQINSPPAAAFSPGKKTLLIFYGLPNGNTIEQTVGRALNPGDDWHFDIQHIGAQTRFLRQMIPSRNIVVAYLEANARTIPKSWPAWRKKNGDASLPGIVEKVSRMFSNGPVEIVLGGHSGGGSWVFGFLNAVKTIPNDIVRIAFLDSNYAYDTNGAQAQKFCQWLDASPTHYLCVLAYNDAAGLLNGKPFVSAAGGTWGRSHLMLRDLKTRYPFNSQTNGNLQTETALGGRIKFLLMENPDHKILHTVQVERNGFIEAMVSGTSDEAKGYEYFGERAYSRWIQGNPSKP